FTLRNRRPSHRWRTIVSGGGSSSSPTYRVNSRIPVIAIAAIAPRSAPAATRATRDPREPAPRARSGGGAANSESAASIAFGPRSASMGSISVAAPQRWRDFRVRVARRDERLRAERLVVRRLVLRRLVLRDDRFDARDERARLRRVRLVADARCFTRR